MTFRNTLLQVGHGNAELITRRLFPIGGPVEPSLYLTISEIFNVECITQ